MSDMLYLTTSEVLKITGVSLSTLRDWLRKGVLAPPRTDYGDARMYSVLDAIALAYAMRWRREGLLHVDFIVPFIVSLGYSGLVENVQAHQTFLVPVSNSPRLIDMRKVRVDANDDAWCNRLDLGLCLAQVVEAIGKLPRGSALVPAAAVLTN